MPPERKDERPRVRVRPRGAGREVLHSKNALRRLEIPRPLPHNDESLPRRARNLLNQEKRQRVTPGKVKHLFLEQEKSASSSRSYFTEELRNVMRLLWE